MNLISLLRSASFLLLGLGALVVGGCGGAGAKGPETGKPQTPAADSSCSVAENWCIEHGVPEDICGQCNAKYAAQCREKGDWCKQHNRPESQCFPCHPELKAKFAAEYEVKYGKKPPQ
jgi:hypothetical protein